MTFTPGRGYSPAPTCYGWTCPACGHHWISVVRIGAMTCKCGHRKPNHEHLPYALKLARAKKRFKLRSLLSDIRPRALSEPVSNLPDVDAARRDSEVA